MRTLVDLPDHQVQELDKIAKRGRCSRAALIRQAVGELLAKQQSAVFEEAFGAWGDRKFDGLAYQERLREEW